MTTTATPSAPKQEAPEEEVPSGLFAREPALVLSYTTGLLIWLLAFLTAHGVITGTQASVLTQAVAPVVAGLIVAGSGHLIRRYVSPALQASIVADVQKVEHEFTPAQLHALEGVVAGVVKPLLAHLHPAPTVTLTSQYPDTSGTVVSFSPTITTPAVSPAPATKKAPAPAPKKAPAKKAAPKK